MTNTEPTAPQGRGTAPTKPAPVLSVIIPMYQEAERIGETVRDVIATLDAWALPAEIIAVDDGSSDGTGKLVERIASECAEAGSAAARAVRVVTMPRNAGKGAAVRRGLTESTGSWVLMMDADNSARLSEVTKLARAAHRDGAGLVVGSRNTRDAQVVANPRRKLTGLVFRAALAVLGLGYVKDTQCGFKLYRRDAADLCARHAGEDGFAFDIEHIGLCTRAGLGVAEVGIAWEHRDGGTIRVVRDGIKMLGQAVRIRARLRNAPTSVEADRPAATALVELKPIEATSPIGDGSPQPLGTAR